MAESAPTVAAPKPATKRVKLLCSMAGVDHAYVAGDIITMPIDQAERNIKAGNAVEPNEVELAVEEQRRRRNASR